MNPSSENSIIPNEGGYPFYSPARLREALGLRGGAVLKSRGQNFLTDPNSVNRIGEAIADLCSRLDPHEIEIVEIGPGPGALSFFLWGLVRSLANQGNEVRWFGLEIDPILIELLTEESWPAFSGASCEDSSESGAWRLHTTGAPISSGDAGLRTGEAGYQLEVHNVDAIEWLRTSPARVPRIACGNLPYYISTDLLLSAVQSGATGCAFLLQKEYVNRVADMQKRNSLSVYIRNTMEVQKGPTISRKCFVPPPAVESSMLLLWRHEPRCNPELLENILRASFHGKRKTLQNTWKNAGLQRGLELEKLKAAAEKAGVPTSARAEDLDFEQFYSLTNYYETM